jgi:hypothetical protein
MFIVSGRITQLVLFLSSFLISVVLMRMALSGKKMPRIRNFPAIEAIKEGVGRATETNRPVVFNNGWGGIISAEFSIQTLAGIDILSYVASQTAKTNTKLLVPVYQGATYPLVMNTVYQAYLLAGETEAYKQSVDIRYISDEQWPWISAVMGLLRREKPATNILMGFFWGEALLQTESGHLSGAIQIGGTAQMDAIPYFAATVDYFLIGEELYAAAAYVSGDPLQMSTIFAEDLVKGIVLALLIIGALLMSVGSNIVITLLRS